MPKPILAEPYRSLERDVIEAMINGLHFWRADLDYPQSYSDLQACARGLLTNYELTRLSLPTALPIEEGEPGARAKEPEAPPAPKNQDTITITITGAPKFRQAIVDAVYKVLMDEDLQFKAMKASSGFTLESSREPSDEVMW